MIRRLKILHIKAILIAILLLSTFTPKAQVTLTPGGTKYNVEFWLSSDKLSNVNGANGTSVSVWNDLSSNGFNFQVPAGRTAPLFANTDILNFQPAVRKAGDNTIKMISQRTFSRTRNKSYYIFYVSKKETTTSNYPTVLSLGTTYDRVGWFRVYNNLYGRVYSDASTSMRPATSGKNYGIGAHIIPNITDGLRRLYHNGSQVVKTGGRTGTTSSTPVLFTASTSPASSTNYFNGDIYEVFVLSTESGIDIAPQELQKIHSYLAIKYGVSLSGQKDLYNSSGIKVWDSNKSRGYSNHVFGLARDDKSNLYQKQSANMDNSDFVIFKGDELKDLNARNTSGELNDQDFVLLGNNGLQGIAAYGVLANNAFRNGVSFDRDLNYRNKQIYSVQVSGTSSQVVNFKLPKGRTIMLVSDSPTFDRLKTDAYEATNQIVTGVTLTGNQYISFILEPDDTPIDYTTKVWLKSDDNVSTTASNVTSWASSNGVSASFSASGTARRPAYNTTTNLMNYRPSVKFSADAHFLQGPDLNLTSTESYYTFTVSKFDRNGSGTYFTEGSVLFTLNYNRTNYDMWSVKNGAIAPTLMTSKNATSYTQSRNKTYGIMGMIRPNHEDIPQMIYFNGNFEETDKQVLKLDEGAGGFASLGGSSIYGGNNYNSFFGEVQEVIMLSTFNRSQIDLFEAFRINSYLAFKYGLTIETDYISGKGTPFWTQDRATDDDGTVYSKSIFGIGRGRLGPGGANAPELIQNQGRPYHGNYQGPFSVYVGTFNSLNKDNLATTIPEETYLMLSSYAEIRSIRPMETPIVENSVFRNGGTNTFELNYSTATYKVQLTSAQTTSMAVNVRTHVTNPERSYLLISKSPEFKMSDTDLYQFTTSGDVAVTLSDGDYIVIVAEDQEAPGGVAETLKMWLRADKKASTIDIVSDVVPEEGSRDNAVQEWRSYSKDAVVFNYLGNTNNYRPSFLECAERLNYHEAVNFKPTTGDNPNRLEYLSSTTPIMSQAAPPEYTFFTVFFNNFTNNAAGGYIASYYMGFGDTSPGTGSTGNAEARRPAFGSARKENTSIGVGRLWDESGAENVDGTQDLFRPKATAIAMVEVHKNVKARFEYDGYGEDILSTTIGRSSKMNVSSMLGIGSRRQRGLDGQMGEIFAYERALSDDEKVSVYSYLGLKYGITLDNDKTSAFDNYDYTFSNGKLLWPGTASPIHQAFHNNVAALVRDEVGGLNNRVSHSTGDGAIIQMAVVDDTNRDNITIGCNSANFRDLKEDKTAVVWGHNGVEGMVALDQQADNVCGNMDERYERIWLVDLVGMEKQEVVIGAGGYGFDEYAYEANDVYLLVSNDYTTIENNQWEQAIPMPWKDGMHQVIYTFTDKYTYFSIGVKENSGGCDACEATGDGRFAFTKANWPNKTKAKRVSMGNGIDMNLEFVVQNSTSTTRTARFYSTNPRASTGNSLRLTRVYRLADPMLATMTFLDASTSEKVAAAVEFDIWEIGGYSYSRYEDIVVWGKCDGRTVRPKVSYVLSEKNSSYILQEKKSVPGEAKADAGAGAIAKRRPGGSYAHSRSKLHVMFDSPVKEVYVQYKSTGSSKSTGGIKRMGLSPVSISCPVPLPPPNEDGLVFSKRANPTQLLLCQEVELVYRINNVNCSEKPVTFSETLPDGMIWVEETLSSDYNLAFTDAKVAFSGKTLTIEDLTLRGGGDTYIRINARFETTAIAKVYQITGTNIVYSQIVDGKIIQQPPLYATDSNTGTNTTNIDALEASMRPEPVKISDMVSSITCYGAENEIELTFNLTNSNNYAINGIDEIGTTEFEILFNEEFTLIDTKIATDGITMTDITDPGEPGDVLDGMKVFEVNKIPVGTHSVTMKLKAPVNSKLVQDEEIVRDANGNIEYDGNGEPKMELLWWDKAKTIPVYVPLIVDFTFTLSEPDECGDSMLSNTNGTFQIECCKPVKNIFSNTHVTQKFEKGLEEEGEGEGGE